MDRRALTVTLLTLAAHGLAQAGGIQRWTDAQGNVHFGDAPPPGVAAERLGRQAQHTPPSDFNALELQAATTASRTASPLRQALRQMLPAPGMAGYRVRESLGRPSQVTTLSYGLGREDRWTYLDEDGARLEIIIKNDLVHEVSPSPALRELFAGSAEGVTAAHAH